MLLVVIASISLLVGGIGIMNIMLATVTERTREIGIRRALGAKRRDITMQFIIEAVVQTSIGGLLGIAVGLAMVFGVPPITRPVHEEAAAGSARSDFDLHLVGGRRGRRRPVRLVSRLACLAARSHRSAAAQLTDRRLASMVSRAKQ